MPTVLQQQTYTSTHTHTPVRERARLIMSYTWRDHVIDHQSMESDKTRYTRTCGRLTGLIKNRFILLFFRCPQTFKILYERPTLLRRGHSQFDDSIIINKSKNYY